MADKKDVQTENVQSGDPAEKVIERARGFWEKYSRMMIYGGSALIILFGGY